VAGLGNALLNLALGYFAARIGFVLAQLSVAAFSLLLWKGTGLPWFALGYFLLGGYRACRSLIYAQIRPLIHKVQMGLAYGVAETFSSLGAMISPLLAGILYTYNPVVVYPVTIGLVVCGVILSLVYSPREKIESMPIVSLPPEM
jgi:hypothetical protein